MKNYKTMANLLCMLLVPLLVVGCASQETKTAKTNAGRYKVVKDYGPDAKIDVSHVADAVPKVEPLSRGGNRSRYKVFGKEYSVLASSAGYSETGGASWYGKKFHGYLTANGEKYDMFKMSAAHKSLPIPTYVEVTNLANGRKIIVRVNDRGPFHKGRIIDLSYAAASKLDMLKQGTSQVSVVAIDPKTWQQSPAVTAQKVAVTPSNPTVDDEREAVGQFLLTSAKKPKVVDNLQAPVAVTSAVAKVERQAVKHQPRADLYRGIHYVQVGVYSSEEAAHAVTLKVKDYQLPVLISEVKKAEMKLYKVILGPVKSRTDTLQLTDELSMMGFPGAHLIDLPK
ncbi:MAG: septal ring lytic transglycosylase RlpA family protein [Oceanospirillaceae bacterium]|nr:septal ring lytic transglycosylase RlpA family protein [Oceanospirillaceae bacterium]